MYKVIKEYNVIDKYADRMWDLQKDLQIFLEEKFANRTIEFAPDERIVFDLTDTDYFIDADFPGFVLYNLQLVLKELNIPNFSCAVLSNMPDYDYYTKKVRDLLRPDDVPLRAITISSNEYVLLSIGELPKSIKANVNDIEFPFIVMSRLRRFHRTFFMSKLFEPGLHTKGMVAYHNIDNSRGDSAVNNSKSSSIADRDSDNSLFFLTTTPFTLHNNENLVANPENRILVDKFSSEVPEYKNFDDGIIVADKMGSGQYQRDLIQKSLVYIAFETVVKYPKAYQSEKTFKSIAQKRPFIIFGPPGCINLLKDQGFRTFDRWWDESYDKEYNMEKRVDMIIDIVKYLASLDVKSLRNLYREMEPLLEYNYHHLTNTFITDQLSTKDRVLSQSVISYD